MNMISIGTFQNEMDASNRQETISEKFARVWEKKNAKAAKAGGVSLMALSLAACGSDDTTSTSSSSTSTTTTTVTASGAALTNATDTVSASGTIDAGLVWSPGGDTRVASLQSEDTVTGTGDADVINISNNGGTVAPKLVGVETVNFTVAGATAGTLNVSNSTGITSADVSSTDGDVGITGMGSGVALAANDIADPATNAFFAMKATAVAGTADSATVTVDGFLGTNLNIGASAAANTAGTGIETLTVASTGETSSIASLGSTGATTVNVNAAAKLTVSALTATGVTTVDASGSTAATSLNVADNVSANVFSYTGGSGNDTLIAASGFAGTDSLDGGDGADTLSIRPAATAGDVTVGALNSASAAVFSNIETLDMRGQDGTGDHNFTVDMDTTPGVTAISMRAGDIDAVTSFNLNDLDATQAAALTLSLNGTGATTATDATVNLDMKDGSGTADAATVNVTLTADGNGTHANNQTVRIDDVNNNIESLTVNMSGSYSAILNMDTSSYATSLTVTGGAADENLRLSANVANATVDMSGVLSDIGDATNHLTTSGVNQTVTTGSGKDYITMDTGQKTIDTGAGNDWVDTADTATEVSATGAAVADTIDGGAGTDTLVIDDVLNATYAAGLKNFERLVVENDTGDGTPTHDMSVYAASTFTTLRIDDAATDFTKVGAAVATLEITAAGATSAGLDRLVDTTTDSLTVKATANTGDIGTVTLSDEETLTFNAADGTLDMTLSAADATSITASGDNTVDLGTVVGSTALATVDASGMTSGADLIGNFSASLVAMTVTAHGSATNTTSIINVTTGSGADTVTGGAGADVITTGNGIDTIVGGGGADDITSGLGADTITGGTGADEFMYTGTYVTSAGDVITDFTVGSGGDEIQLDTAAGATVSLEAINADALAANKADDGDVFIIKGGNAIDMSGGNTSDLATLNALIMDAGLDAADAGAEVLVVINADTNGDGTADEIQVWGLHETSGASSTFDEAMHIASLTNIAASTSMTATTFHATNFDFI